MVGLILKWMGLPQSYDDDALEERVERERSVWVELVVQWVELAVKWVELGAVKGKEVEVQALRVWLVSKRLLETSLHCL